MFDRADVTYRYDGSFEGMLCCVFESFARRELPASVAPPDRGQLTFTPEVWIETDPEHARRVFASVSKKISKAAAQLVSDIFLSCMEEKELALIRFLCLGYRYGAAVMDMLADDTVNALYRAQLYLKNESHLTLEFLRFSEIKGVLIAQIEPQNFVLPKIQEHFCARFSGERFLIYDRPHQAILAYQPFEARIFSVEGFELPKAEEEEQLYRDLWQHYYDSIAIKERENPVCRRNHMPKRYWNCMTEFQNLPREARRTLKNREETLLK